MLRKGKAEGAVERKRGRVENAAVGQLAGTASDQS